MDPDYVNEILIRMRADTDYGAAQERKRKRQKKQGARAGREVVDADLSEIE